MIHTLRALVALPLALGALIGGVGFNPAPAGAESCRYFELSAILVNVRRDPARPGGYLDVLEKGDTACVTEERKIDNVTWAFVRDKTGQDGNVAEVGGWANMLYLTPGSAPAASETAAAPATPEEPPSPEAQSGPAKPAAEPETVAEPAAPEKPASTTASQTASAAPTRAPSDQLRFDEPVPFGAYPVQGRTLKELAGGEPLFPPIEGLPEELWKKPCATCHKWNQERLCEQGNSYLKAAKYVLRHQHPYGGTYKLALMRWAKSGCE